MLKLEENYVVSGSDYFKISIHYYIQFIYHANSLEKYYDMIAKLLLSLDFL